MQVKKKPALKVQNTIKIIQKVQEAIGMNLPVRSLIETPTEAKRKMRSDEFRLKKGKKRSDGKTTLSDWAPEGGNSVLWAGQTKVAGELNPAVLHPHVGIACEALQSGFLHEHTFAG